MKRAFQKDDHLWSVETVGKRVTTTWGVAGGKTQSKSADQDTPDSAAVDARRQARDKLRAGYAETTFRGPLPLDAPAARGLLEALAENPDDIAPHMAFADWLGEQADDRLTAWGEIIRLQLMLERMPGAGKRKSPESKRIEQLRDEYEMHWLGEELAVPLLGMGIDGDRDRSEFAYEAPKRTFVRGWLDSLSVFGPDKKLAHAIAKAPALRLLQTLTIADPEEDGVLAALAKATALGNVRHLSFISSEPDRGLSALVRSLPRLKSLRLAVTDLATPALFALPELSRLDTLEVVGPSRYAVKALAGNPAVANLRRLALNTVTGHEDISVEDRLGDEPTTIGGEAIRALCQSPHLTGLKELALHSAEFTADACRALGESGLFARLESLDLTGGDLYDASAEALIAYPDFARIPRVILDRNFLEPGTVRLLRKINKGVRANDQRNPLEGHPDLDDFDDDWE